MGFKFEGKWSLLTALQLSPNPKHSFLGLVAGRGEREERETQPPNGFRCGAKFENAVGLALCQ